MPILITGQARSGKSRLAKEIIIPAHRRTGRWIGVLDPTGLPWPAANWVTTDPLEFAARMKRARNCVGFVDEFARFRANYEAMTALEELFYMGGNYGNLFYALGQRLMMVPPNVRSQCDSAIIFRQFPTSLELLVEQYNEPRIRACAAFPPGIAMIVETFKAPRIVRTFTRADNAHFTIPDLSGGENVKRNHFNSRPQTASRRGMDPATTRSAP